LLGERFHLGEKQYSAEIELIELIERRWGPGEIEYYERGDQTSSVVAAAAAAAGVVVR